MDILYLVDRLENLIASSRRMPLVNQIILKEGDILSIVDEMRTAIPDEIKQARRVLQDKERILSQAQAEAAALLAHAHEESERAMNREGLLRAAEQRSREMVRQAEEQTERLKVDADAYVAETLQHLREHLMNIETEIGQTMMNFEAEVGRTVMSIERGLESITSQLSEHEDYGVYEEATGEDTQDKLEAEDVEGLEEPVVQPMTAQPIPRKASLATDTMGGPMYP